MSDKLPINDDLIDYLAEHTDVDEDTAIGIGLLCRPEFRAKEMLDYCKSHPNADSCDLLEKAVKIHRSVN